MYNLQNTELEETLDYNGITLCSIALYMDGDGVSASNYIIFEPKEAING